jgi:hypothetical protein
MARYSAFLGCAVEVQYRAGDICLPASGTFVGDSGRSIFLEQHYEQHGQAKNFRWEIPYQCIVRLEQIAAIESFQQPARSVIFEADETQAALGRDLQASAAHASGGATLLPIPPPKPA